MPWRGVSKIIPPIRQFMKTIPLKYSKALILHKLFHAFTLVKSKLRNSIATPSPCRNILIFFSSLFASTWSSVKLFII